MVIETLLSLGIPTKVKIGFLIESSEEGGGKNFSIEGETPKTRKILSSIDEGDKEICRAWRIDDGMLSLI